MGKFICIGLNYADHAAETGSPIPKEPIVFMKTTSALVGCNDASCCRRARSRPTGRSSSASSSAARRATSTEADALKHVAGYCVVNDVSEREYQLERGGTWDKGKGCDTFGPVGPWMVTADEVADPQNAGDVARGQRQALPERQHRDDDLRRRRAGRLLSAAS